MNFNELWAFFSHQRDFLKVIPKYANFLKSHQIELGILLCDQLSEEEADGITYREAKQCSKVLDVIELARTADPDEEEDPHNPTGYEELQQALRSFLWSSAEVSNGKQFSFILEPLHCWPLARKIPPFFFIDF